MKKLLVAGVVVLTLAFTAAASAALVPGVFDPGSTGCVKSTYIKKTKTLHLEKNCPTATNAAAFAEMTGVSGQAFGSASFTLASTSQCQGGSPRFKRGRRRPGCSSSAATTWRRRRNGGTALRPTPSRPRRSLQLVSRYPTPTGTVQSVSLLLDVQGTADLTNVTFNGKLQKVAGGGKGDVARPCKKGGWKTFTNPTFKNQGQCVKFLVHGRNAAKKTA